MMVGSGMGEYSILIRVQKNLNNGSNLKIYLRDTSLQLLVKMIVLLIYLIPSKTGLQQWDLSK